MAKILFVSDNYLNEGLGIMCLSSYVKTAGHEVDLTLLQDFKRIDDLIDYVEAYDPDLVGFSVMTPQVTQFRPISRLIKKRTGKTIIWGGSHCMLMQKDIMNYDGVDIICVGDGEEALMDLMNHIEDGEDYSEIPNLYVKTPKGWAKNPVRSAENNLDKYPFPDRGLYFNKYPLMAEFAVKRFVTSRGCPYKCSYCFEPSYFKMYKGKGKTFRRHSTEYVISEIKDVIEKYPTRRVNFADDTFNIDKKWVKEFCEKYKKNFDVNWSCNIELTSIDEDIVQSMADSGCRGCVFGLESGVESIRMNVLNKKITNARYIEATNWLKKHNLKFFMNLMFCLPNESLDDAIESLRFAIQLKSNGIRVNILKMYKGTEITNYANANGLSEGIGEFTYKAKDFYGEFHRIANVAWATILFQHFPFLLRWGRTILTKKFGKVLGPIHLLLHWQDIKFYDIPLWQAWKFFWNSRDIFIGGLAKAQKDTYIGDDGTFRDSKELFASPLGVVDWSGNKTNKIFKNLNKERYKKLNENSDAHFSSMEPEILNALRRVKIPYKNGKNIVDLGMVSNIDMVDGSITFTIKTNFSGEVLQWSSLKKDAEKSVLDVDGVFKVTAKLLSI